jgi:hypothetical protein
MSFAKKNKNKKKGEVTDAETAEDEPEPTTSSFAEAKTSHHEELHLDKKLFTPFTVGDVK